ncbi:hypothetical protein ACA910_012932 [Epithemia clementina (nom. ined.)]
MEDPQGEQQAQSSALMENAFPGITWAMVTAERMRAYSKQDNIEGTTATESAVKRDDAEVPTHLWDSRMLYLLNSRALTRQHRQAFDLLRQVMWQRWRRNVLVSWRRWWEDHRTSLMSIDSDVAEIIRDHGRRACLHARRSTFWSWDQGSAVFFWRWPEAYMRDLALGVPPNCIDTPNPTITKQKSLGEQEMLALIAVKISDVRRKGYISPGVCRATMNFFAVAKGESDIRMVYNGTKSGLNDCLYAPWFPLPDAEVLINTLDYNYWCIDNDYEEMFLNFWLHPELSVYSGMDLTALYGRRLDNSARFLEVWTRCPMGQSPSPYATVQQTRQLKRIMFGNRLDPTNVFRWCTVVLNLPGTMEYRPGIPWISKKRQTGEIAADAHDYVDDLRGPPPTEEDAWQVGSTIAKTASYHGVQHAAQKRREQTTQPGAWAGVVCGTSPDRPFVAVMQTKWDRTKSEVHRLRQAIDEASSAAGDGKVDCKMLEQTAGFLNHVAQAYHTIKMYLNGVYATMNVWRPDRDKEGWKVGNTKVEYDHLRAPARVRLVN